MAELTKTDRLVEEVQHFAGDLYDLLRSKGTGRNLSDAELRRQRRELADTLTSKMLLVGPLRNERGHYFRAAGGPLVEYVTTPTRHHWPLAAPSYEVLSLDGPLRTSPYGWLYALSSATPCPLEEFEQAAHGVLLGPAWEQFSLARAGERWDAAELALVTAGLLPLASHRSSAVGGARFVADVWVEAARVPAFRQAAWEMGGCVEVEQPPASPATCTLCRLTVAVAKPADLFDIGQLVVLLSQQQK
jgi:hypothetical protein